MQAEPARQAACAVLAEITTATIRDEQPEAATFRLLGAVLAALEGGLHPWLAVRYAEYWTLKLHGVLPDLSQCAECGEPLAVSSLRFAVPGVGCLCGSCPKPQGAVALRAAELEALAVIDKNPPHALLFPLEVARPRPLGGVSSRNDRSVRREVLPLLPALAGGDVVNFQRLLLGIQGFWADRGCVLQQPYDIEVGAGTMHPDTFLRVLGPEPWKVAYCQPSRRPGDGRYGENPMRVYKHFQFQVILKPSPLDVQALYLESLRAFGIDPLEHDIRFEEDNWESPTLGAAGVGWQVVMDGMECSQFSYF
jgi:hypothetical protein